VQEQSRGRLPHLPIGRAGVPGELTKDAVTWQNVTLGDSTTFGGVLSRLGVPSGERFLRNMLFKVDERE
jgi:hypothetical protein